MTKKVLPPVHPGEILLEEFMKPLGISQKPACPGPQGSSATDK